MLDELIITIITVVVSIATATASLGYWLGRKFSETDNKFTVIGERLIRLEYTINQFSETLILMLESKGIFTPAEAVGIRNLVKALLPMPRSKYYTWEVYERLKRLLDKDPNEYAMADIEEMNSMADLIEKEGWETNRRDLLEYASKLRFYAMIAKVVFIYPKLLKGSSQQRG
ncbi:MAG: hypothetical protein QXE01_01025 [Sulfolobales archaeon]